MHHKPTTASFYSSQQQKWIRRKRLKNKLNRKTLRCHASEKIFVRPKKEKRYRRARKLDSLSVLAIKKSESKEKPSLLWKLKQKESKQK